MFAYCLNNPVNCYDSSGTHAISYCNDDWQPFLDNYYGYGGGAGGGSGIVVVPLVDPLMVVDLKELAEAKAEALALKQKSEDTYTVYFLCKTGDVSKTIIYVGRVKTANFDARMNYHRTQGREHVASIGGLDYNTCRGMEQVGMVYFHTINRHAAINNQIRGISPTNKNLYMYMAALWDYINSSTYTGNEILPPSYFANLTEEAFLNGTL